MRGWYKSAFFYNCFLSWQFQYTKKSFVYKNVSCQSTKNNQQERNKLKKNIITVILTFKLGQGMNKIYNTGLSTMNVLNKRKTQINILEIG